ncbi:MAG: hypothetical protein MZV70_00905 [Desulfobacterales bacterium]|nr:hypothetical protein [Desulfobacterales bacterium]
MTHYVACSANSRRCRGCGSSSPVVSPPAQQLSGVQRRSAVLRLQKGPLYERSPAPEEPHQGLNVDEIQFSVDGMEHGHEALRGRVHDGKVMDRIGDTLSEGMSVSVATMVHRENLEEFDRMDLLFRGMGIRDWTVDVPCVSGSFAENALLQVPPEITGPYFSYGFGGGLHGGGEGYGCGLHLASVLADGTVAKCFLRAQDGGAGKRGSQRSMEPDQACPPR